MDVYQLKLYQITVLAQVLMFLYFCMLVHKEDVDEKLGEIRFFIFILILFRGALWIRNLTAFLRGF